MRLRLEPGCRGFGQRVLYAGLAVARRLVALSRALGRSTAHRLTGSPERSVTISPQVIRTDLAPFAASSARRPVRRRTEPGLPRLETGRRPGLPGVGREPVW